MIKKMTLSFVVTALLVGSAYGDKIYSDRTYMAPRTVLTNIPMEYTTWHRFLHNKADTKNDGTVQIVPFYQSSQSKSNIGKYFGYDWEGQEGLGVMNQVGVSPTDAKILKFPRDIMHDYTGATAGTLTANYDFRPDQRIYGVRLSVNQDLDKILDGLFFRLNAPIVSVRNDMSINSLTTQAKQRLTAGNAIAAAGKEYSFLDYLSGNLENNDADNFQERLKYAQITGGSHSASGLADIEATLGYTFWHKGRLRFALSSSLIIPTGNTPNARNLFEPIYGNGNHWGLALGLDKTIVLWKKENKFIEFSFIAKYKYLFESVEKRTLDFIRVNDEKPSAGYYNMGGKQGSMGVFPLANILTQDMRIGPGSQYESTINLAVGFGGFTFDLGYDFYAREREHVSLKHNWENNTYAEADWAYQTDADFDVMVARAGSIAKAYAYEGAISPALPAAEINAAINEEHLDYHSVATPGQFTNKLYAAFGYECHKRAYPVMAGIGASYEFTNRNTALENWAVWAKLGMAW